MVKKDGMQNLRKDNIKLVKTYLNDKAFIEMYKLYYLKIKNLLKIIRRLCFRKN